MNFNDRHPRPKLGDCNCGARATICEQTHRGRLRRALASFRRTSHYVAEVGACSRGSSKCYQRQTICPECSVREIREAINRLIEDTVRVGKKLKLAATIEKERLWRQKRDREKKLTGVCVSCHRKRIGSSCYCRRHRGLHKIADRRRLFGGQFLRGRDFGGRRTAPGPMRSADWHQEESTERFTSRLAEFQETLEASR